MSETSKRADIVINFPKNGKVVNKDGSVAGYFVDAQYAQQMAAGAAAGHIKANPHLYTDWAHDKNNKAFMNHRQFLPLDVAKNVMKAARMKNAVMYKNKNYDEKLHYNFADTEGAVHNMNNFKATTVLVNAGIDNTLGDNRVLINKYDDFKPAQNLNGIDAKSVLARQDDLTRLAQRKIGVGYSGDQDKNLKAQRYDMMQLTHHLNKEYGVRGEGEVQPDTIIEIAKSGDSPNSYNLKMYKTSELSEDDFDYDNHTIKTQMPVTENGMMKASASMIAERNDMNTRETYDCLNKLYHDGKFDMDAGMAQTYFESVASSFGEKFHPFPNKDSMDNVKSVLNLTLSRARNVEYSSRANNYDVRVNYDNPETGTLEQISWNKNMDTMDELDDWRKDSLQSINQHGFDWTIDKIKADQTTTRLALGSGSPCDLMNAFSKFSRQHGDFLPDTKSKEGLYFDTKNVQDMTKENERMKNPYYVNRENSYTKLQRSLDTPDKSDEQEDDLQF